MVERLLVVSDIHSNLEAFNAVRKDAEKHGPYDIKLCTGDIVGYGPNPNEVTELIREEEYIVRRGNHEKYIIEKISLNANPDAQIASKHNSKILTNDNKKYLASLVNDSYLDPEGKFAMVHGNFYLEYGREYDTGYIKNETDALKAMRSLFFYLEDDSGINIPLGIFGHTHVPMYASCWVNYGDFSEFDPRVGVDKFEFEQHLPNKSETKEFTDLETRTIDIEFGDQPEPGGTIYMSYWYPKALFNPGSVGQPRHGSNAACYAILELDGEKIKIEFRNVEYDIKETQAKMKDAKLPDFLIERLSLGI